MEWGKVRKKERKAWQREGQVGTEGKLLSPVFLAVSCLLDGWLVWVKERQQEATVCTRYGVMLGRCRGQPEHSVTITEGRRCNWCCYHQTIRWFTEAVSGERLVGGGMVGKNMRNWRKKARLKRAWGRSSQDRKPFLLGEVSVVKAIEESSQVRLRSFFPPADSGGIPKSPLFLGFSWA